MLAIRKRRKGTVSSAFPKADARTRTGDPFITSEVLYQLSYVGSRPTVAASAMKETRSPGPKLLVTLDIPQPDVWSWPADAIK
jgi:hypothetical protein